MRVLIWFYWKIRLLKSRYANISLGQSLNNSPSVIT